MCIDSDTIYPPYYFEIMIEELMKPGISAVAAMWSFYPNENHSKLQLKMYEFCRDIFIRIQAINRPELSVRGLAFGYETANAKKEGYSLIIANIVAEIIASIAPMVPDKLLPGGRFITSGIIEHKKEIALQACAAAGLTLIEEKQKGDWHAYYFEKKA